jgi:hypothetical protein
MRPFDIPIAIVILAGFIYYVYRHVTHGMRRNHAAVEASETAPAE